MGSINDDREERGFARDLPGESVDGPRSNPPSPQPFKTVFLGFAFRKNCSHHQVLNFSPRAEESNNGFGQDRDAIHKCFQP